MLKQRIEINILFLHLKSEVLFTGGLWCDVWFDKLVDSEKVDQRTAALFKTGRAFQFIPNFKAK